MSHAISIAAGGAAGALFRFWLSTGVYRLTGRGFPFGTLVVNVGGSALMGFLYALMVERLDTSTELRGALLIGLLGGFTTFSTFSIETLTLIEEGEPVTAAANVAISVALSILACWVGIVAGRLL